MKTNFLAFTILIIVLINLDKANFFEDSSKFYELLKNENYKEIFDNICPLTKNENKICNENFPLEFEFKHKVDGVKGMKYLNSGFFGKVYFEDNKVTKVLIIKKDTNIKRRELGGLCSLRNG